MTAKRIAAIAAIVWSVLAVPAMCMGGILEHACLPHESDDCGHEDACVDDPCSTVLIRTEDGPGAGIAADLVWAIEAVEIEPCGLARTNSCLDLFFRLRSGGLPFPVSDVPLLI